MPSSLGGRGRPSYAFGQPLGWSATEGRLSRASPPGFVGRSIRKGEGSLWQASEASADLLDFPPAAGWPELFPGHPGKPPPRSLGQAETHTLNSHIFNCQLAPSTRPHVGRHSSIGQRAGQAMASARIWPARSAPITCSRSLTRSRTGPSNGARLTMLISVPGTHPRSAR